MSGKNKKAEFLLSTDTLSWYGLDLIFKIASEINFEGIDLCMRKNFDARNITYVKDLIEKYNMPVKVVQVSNKVNSREMNQAVDLAKAVGADVITINPPEIFNFKTYKFISSSLKHYKRHNPSIKFSIINPPQANLYILPVSRYWFSNISEIIKKYKAYLALDIANLDENVLETIFLRKISNFIPYISVVYLSDKTKTDKPHIPLGEWVLKLPAILKKFKMNEYFWYFSLKLDLDKKDLADVDKIKVILKKCRLYYKENFEDLVIS